MLFEDVGAFVSRCFDVELTFFAEIMLLFLDIDGVLHPAPPYNREAGVLCHVTRFESIIRDFLNCQIVICSSWREQFDLDTLRDFFSADIAARIIGVTPVVEESTNFARQREIEQYLADTNQRSIPWVVLDDDAGHFAPGTPNLVLCNKITGIDDVAERQLRNKLTLVTSGL